MTLPTKKSTEQNRNMMLALALCALVFLGTDFIRTHYFPQTLQPQQATTQAVAGNTSAPAVEPGAPVAPAALKADAVKQPAPALSAADTRRVAIKSPTMDGSIALKGGRIDELTLPAFTTSVDDKTPLVLFTPTGKNVFMFEAGWLGDDVKTPTGNTDWQTKDQDLTPTHPLTLTWDNGKGLHFERTYVMAAADYTIHVTDKVTNAGDMPVHLMHYAQLHRGFTDEGLSEAEKQSSYTHFVGPEAFMNNKTTTHSYADILKDGPYKDIGRGGWAGVSTRYFLGAIIPDPSANNTLSYRYTPAGDKKYFSLDVSSDVQTVDPGQTVTADYRLYSGPKEITFLKKQHAGLEQAVNYGWYQVIALLFLQLLRFFHGLVGNWGVAIIVMTVLLKVMLWPLSAKSYEAMSKMKKLQPRITQLKKTYGDNREQMAAEMMALYRQHKVSPASGCWPMFIQVPIFFAYYKVILVSFEFRQAPFMGWIHDLSLKDPYYILPVLMGVVMLLQQRLNPPASDPVQQRVMQFMPLIFAFMFAHFPAGLVLYWLTNSALGAGQQYFIMRRLNAA